MIEITYRFNVKDFYKLLYINLLASIQESLQVYVLISAIFPYFWGIHRICMQGNSLICVTQIKQIPINKPRLKLTPSDAFKNDECLCHSLNSF